MSTRIRLGVLVLGGAAIAALGALFMPTGCTVLTNDALPDDAGPFEGGDGGDGGGACGSCLAQECTGIWATCFLDDTCRAVHECANGGGEISTCLCVPTAAADAGDGGLDPYGAYVAFRRCNDAKLCTACKSDCTQCGSLDGSVDAIPACGRDDGGAADAGDVDGGDGGDAGDAGDAAPPPPVTVDSCTSCVSGSCGDPKKACALGSECETFLDCVYACTDAACADDCGSRYATGKEAARELSDCVTTACEAACGL